MFKCSTFFSQTIHGPRRSEMCWKVILSSKSFGLCNWKPSMLQWREGMCSLWCLQAVERVCAINCPQCALMVRTWQDSCHGFRLCMGMCVSPLIGQILVVCWEKGHLCCWAAAKYSNILCYQHNFHLFMLDQWWYFAMCLVYCCLVVVSLPTEQVSLLYATNTV